ncbi:hypothetical protein WR25_26779 isoform I [Diploscapter pachys]|uniref:Uncharacterized protein n=2 Tax=Diploscapter pachys TaxID=2018661 RepID=A0A2A2KSC0_9BILA|nr:hypothetical protein WR25_26779 isoform A [Diploscapter pachys]PAV76894.1 hypothetical protein WR25_26779 isoform I [Diploscapter pachys]
MVATISAGSPYRASPSKSSQNNAHQNHQNMQGSSNFDRIIDTIPDEELGRVPPIMLQQLARANEVIKQQNREMERLRAGDKSLENERLRKQLHDLDEEIKKSRTNFLTQESLLADMNSELQALLEERRVLQASYAELENKYKRTKLANRELARALEYGFEVEEGTSKDDYLRRSEESLLEQSRRHANEATTSKEPVRDQKNFESHAEYRVQGSPPDTSALKSDTSEVKQLREQLEKEIRMNESLHKDLEASRRMLLGRESELAEMKTKFAEMQMRLTQVFLLKTYIIKC